MRADVRHNENGDSKVRDELLSREIFYTLREAQVLIERWPDHDNTERPHGSVGYRPPAPQAILPNPVGPPYAELQVARPGA